MTKRKNEILDMREQLLLRREAIHRALAGDLSLLQELKDHTSGDAADIASGSSQDEISSRLVEVESRELAQIDKALDRMEGGEYGNCEACGDSIPVARLRALPYATQCVRCQEESEHQTRIEDQQIDWSALVDPSETDEYSLSNTNLA